MTYRGTRLSLILCFAALAPGQSLAGPRIIDVSPRGLRSGATTTLTIQGTDLLPAPRLVLQVAGNTSAIKPGGTANQVQLDIALPAQTRPGIYELRLATPKGISNSIAVCIDDLEEAPLNSQIPKLPIALHGTLAGSSILEASFAGRKGQHILVEIEARRLGSAIEPVLELYDARPVQLAWAQGSASLGGDARLETTLPADGHYKITLHDILYRAGSPGAFRLKIGDLSTADLIYPLGGQRGTVQNFELIGPGFSPGRQLTVDLRGRNADFSCPLPARPGLTGPAPRIVLGEYPEVMQALPLSGVLQEIAPPVAINGRLAEHGREDRYRLLVKPGSRWRFDLLASLAGSPLDGVLTLANESGTHLAESDDRPDTVDPGLDFTVPKGTNSLVAGIRDLLGRGGPEFVYRLAVTPLDRPDFRLQMFESEHDVPRGGNAIVRVRAERAGYNGPIRLLMRGLPADVNLVSEGIPAGATDALLTLSAAADGKLADAFTQLVGESSEPGTALRRQAQIMPKLRPAGFTVPDEDIALAVTEPSPIAIAWDGPPDQLQTGATPSLKFSLKRRPNLPGAISLALLTSQVVPRTADGKSEDANRALRLAPAQPIPATEAHPAATVVVPADLHVMPYDLAIRAELLGVDNTTVLETAVTPSRRFRVVSPPPPAKK
jgi:hypothetical protein